MIYYLFVNILQVFNLHLIQTLSHYEEHNISSMERNGCHRGSFGYKDLLLINRKNLDNIHTKYKNLSVARIDYKKAFDSIHQQLWISYDIYHSGRQICYSHILMMCND